MLIIKQLFHVHFISIDTEVEIYLNVSARHNKSLLVTDPFNVNNYRKWIKYIFFCFSKTI